MFKQSQWWSRRLHGPINRPNNRFIDQLNEVNTDNVHPLSSVTGHDLPLRKDKIIDGDINDKILKNAPEKISGYFVVPKVVE